MTARANPRDTRCPPQGLEPSLTRQNACGVPARTVSLGYLKPRFGSSAFTIIPVKTDSKSACQLQRSLGGEVRCQLSLSKAVHRDLPSAIVVCASCSSAPSGVGASCFVV